MMRKIRIAVGSSIFVVGMGITLLGRWIGGKEVLDFLDSLPNDYPA